jgi:ketosteroid isomerase-like protein
MPYIVMGMASLPLDPGTANFYRIVSIKKRTINAGATRDNSREHKGAKAMSDQTNTDEIRIKVLLEAWADAVRRHDITAILAYHERDIVMFDLPPPLQCKGIKAYEQTWDLLFRYHKPGTAFDIQEVAVTAGQDVAFAVAIMRCGPDSSSNPAERTVSCSG